MSPKLFVILLIAALHFAEGTKHPNKFIDLTYAFNNETMVWPGRKSSFYIEAEGYTPSGVWLASKGFCTSEHTSTHIDAPYHFSKEGRKLHEVPLEDLIEVPGVMIDIYDKVHKFKDGKLSVIENYALTQEDVLEWEEKHGKIPQGAVVLLRTGWASRWGNQKLYSGDKSEDKEPEEAPVPGADQTIALDVSLNFPSFDVTSARYLATERQVLGVGVDVLSIDPGNSKNFLSHRLFASRNIYMLEMVANLHLLPPHGFSLWIVPFKIDFGTGAPTRVLARLDKVGAGKERSGSRDL
jgi:kynurenine formamidase